MPPRESSSSSATSTAAASTLGASLLTTLKDSSEAAAFEEEVPDSPTHSLVDQRQHESPQQALAATKQQHSEAAGPSPRPPPPGPEPGTAHVHVVGEVTGAHGLGSQPLYCTWQLAYDAALWSVLRGRTQGRTFASSPQQAEDGGLCGVVWDAPVDVLLATGASQRTAPSLVFKLFQRSVWLGRDAFVGYSLVSLPNTPGCHHLSCPVWVATEGRASLANELTKLFTGLNPQLVNEGFITDLEQRYEQGQHLHTLGCSASSSSGCSSGPEFAPTGLAMQAVGGCGQQSGGRQFCTSFSAAGSGGTGAPGAASAMAAASAGGRISLRLHVLTRGMDQLPRWRGGDGVGVSIGRCLERLHSNVDRMRRQHHARLKPAGDSSEAGGDGDETELEESRGVQLVRAGRAERLSAVQGRLAARDSDGPRPRPRDQKQQGPEERQHPDAEQPPQQLLSFAGGRRPVAGSTSTTVATGRRFTPLASSGSSAAERASVGL